MYSSTVTVNNGSIIPFIHPYLLRYGSGEHCTTIHFFEHIERSVSRLGRLMQSPPNVVEQQGQFLLFLLYTADIWVSEDEYETKVQ